MTESKDFSLRAERGGKVPGYVVADKRTRGLARGHLLFLSIIWYIFYMENTDVKRLLEENLKLSKENNVLLQKIHSIQRWAQITRVLYWLVIVGVSIGAFYFIKPFLGNITNLYTGGVSGINNIGDITKNLSSKEQIQDLLKSLNQ